MKKFNAEVLEQLINTSPAAMFVVDKERNMLFANKSYAAMFGYTQEEVLHVNARKFHISDESYEEFGAIAFRAVREKKTVATDFHAKRKDGTLIWVHVVGSFVEDEDLVLWTMIDITKRKEVEQEVQKYNYNLQQYLNAIDKIEIGIFVVDGDFRVRYMNNSMKGWFGNQEGKICYSSVANLQEPCPYCKLKEVIEENQKVVYDPTTPDGQSFEIVATPIQDGTGEMLKMEVIRNITSQKQAQKKLLEQQELLQHQAHYDVLTELPNRVFFNNTLSHAIAKAKRNKTKVALFFIDLDHFKEINDSLGHDIGDRVLQQVAQKLRDTLRKEDSLARLGGDEFTVIIEDVEDPQSISVLATKITATLAQGLRVQSHTLYISSSIGISVYPDDGSNAKDLLKYADSAMYKAKANGRNNFQFYSYEMTQQAIDKITLQNSLVEALANKEFVVYYQPQVDAVTKKIVGLEALSRWNHPTQGVVTPDKFIPLAESTGHIVELDRYIMDKAMQEFSSWKEQGYQAGVLSLNLSIKHLQQKDFFEYLRMIMQKHNFKPEFLELEVTESQIMTDPKEATKILQAISSLGIKIAVDDFGTGYSSLSYLKKFPIDKLKIDQSFVKELPEDDEDVAITRAIIALAKSLHLDLIAEGVENLQQERFMVENGCKNIQGYLYSEPLVEKELLKFLAKYKNRL